MYGDIITKFAEADILVNHNAYQKIKSQEDSSKFAESIIRDLALSQEDMLILTGEMVDQYLKKTGSPLETSDHLESPLEKKIVSQKKLIPDKPFDIQVLRDASRKSYTNGEIKDFSAYFGSRYHKIKEMLQRKKDLKTPQPLRDIENNDVVNIIGMVKDVRYTKNNHKLIVVEDETGEAMVLVHNENHSLFEDAERVVKDEVLGVVGTRKNSLILASQLINPGIPRIEEKRWISLQFFFQTPILEAPHFWVMLSTVLCGG